MQSTNIFGQMWFQRLNVYRKGEILKHWFTVPIVVIFTIIDIAEPAMTMKRLEICIGLKNKLWSNLWMKLWKWNKNWKSETLLTGKWTIKCDIAVARFSIGTSFIITYETARSSNNISVANVRQFLIFIFAWFWTRGFSMITWNLLNFHTIKMLTCNFQFLCDEE